ncbi:MAG: immunity 49 family protein [Leptolyngbya sp. SIO1E4]|nr:immunity 49 family protein [Leptolyngbya sp. SIO1E4]
MNPVARSVTGDFQVWQEQLAHIERLLKVVRDRTPCAEDGTDLLKDELRRAQVASLFSEQQTDIYDALSRAAGAAQAAMVTQQRWRRYEDDGQVELQEPDRPPRLIPVGDARLHWPTWVQGLAAALITRDDDALNTLCTPESIEACSLPTSHIDPFWPFYCSALAAAVVEPTAASALIADATTGLNQAKIADPALIQLRLRPVLELVAALATNDTDTFNTALHKALVAHRQLCEQRDMYDWSGLFALEATALAALAHDRQLSITVTSDYLPTALVNGDFPRDRAHVIYHFPQRSILTADEAHWFLDLAGFPPQARSHQLLNNNGQLIARYEAQNAPGLPHAIASFALIETSDLPNPAPLLALDAGQLLFLAEAYASDIPDDEQQANARINEAIACVNAVLARIPPDQAVVPAGTITSARGQQLYQTESGRFRRDRLVAYRDALAAHHSSSHTSSVQLSPHEEASSTADPYDTAIAAVEIIRANLMPLLAALAQDEQGTVLAQIMPQETDYEQVFIGDAIAIARQAYQQFWQKTRRFQRPAASQSEIRCYLAPAGMLRDDNELSFHFPKGYRAIAEYLNPHRVWATWQYHSPGQDTGINYDGLVWVEDHWAWFPKPYRLLRIN